ncbi:MAG: WbqC family protein [Prevotella sp.]|nr:WbqC family protein [Prevotella sp.]
MSTVLLQTTYFGPIQWYQKLYRYNSSLIEQYDSYQKQTYRNRCVIATANGLQALTVPVEHNSQLVKDLRISDHNQWRRVHWNALQSAYSESPFFDYYADDIRPFFEKKYEFLIDFNESIRQTICDLLDIQPKVEYTSGYEKQMEGVDDYREIINAKHPQADADFQPRRYWQVFEGKHGFQANLSILDLLFNTGNEAIFYL